MDNKVETIYAFIDSQNLNLSILYDLTDKKTGEIVYRGWKLDFKRFFIYLKDKYKVDKSFLFIGLVKQNNGLYRYLQEAGYYMIYKPTLEYTRDKEKHIKGNVDAELILHTMIEYPNYDKAIIVAGDGDYHCLIEYLEKQNKLLHLFIPNEYSYSSLLKKFRPFIVYINGLKSKLEERKKVK